MRHVGLCVMLLGMLAVGVHLIPLNLTEPTDGRSEATAATFVGVRDALAYAAADGEEIYQTRCMSCHQLNGKGIPGVFPPLDGSEWVTGDKGRLVRILLYGIQGEIEIQGTVYSGAMPPWNTFLDDEQLAALSTYIRTSWGNEASEVTATEVAAVRKATADRKQPWTAEELQQEAHQGIPGAEETASDSTGSEGR